MLKRSKWICSVFLLLVFSPLSFSKTAVDFSLPGLTGQVSLAEHKGKVVYLDFWASWCKPCVKSFPWMNEMQQKYKDKLVVIGVNLDPTRQEAQQFLDKVKADFAIAFDHNGELAQTYQVQGMPSAYLISHDGKVLTSHIGFVPAKKAQYEQQLLLAFKQMGAN